MNLSDYTVTSPSQKNSEVSRSEHEILTEALESFEGQLSLATIKDGFYFTYMEQHKNASTCGCK